MYHTMTICEEIAERMKNPLHVKDIMERQYQDYQSEELFWDPLTLSDGFAGIACFYGMMDRVYPAGGWADIAHDYLKEITLLIEERGLHYPSLFSGTTGICLPFAICSLGGERYKTSLEKLEAILIEQIEEQFIQKGNEYLATNAPLPAAFYCFSDGISGLIGYANLRKENQNLYEAVRKAISVLVDLLQRPVAGKPRWYFPRDYLFDEHERSKYEEGGFILNMPFGITGCLLALAEAEQSQMGIPGCKELIAHIATWLKEQAEVKGELYYFGNTLPIQGPALEEIPRDSWWYGLPAVSTALWKAGKAINDQSLQAFAEKALKTMMQKDKKEWNLMGTSFMHGRAGMLALFNCMAQETEKPFFWDAVKECEQDLLHFYRPHSAFGFQTVFVDAYEKYHWVDSPGFLYGTSGIALTLMTLQNRGELEWDKAFLLR